MKQRKFEVTMVIEMFQTVKVSARSPKEAFEKVADGGGRWLKPDGGGDPEYHYMQERLDDGRLVLVMQRDA